LEVGINYEPLKNSRNIIAGKLLVPSLHYGRYKKDGKQTMGFKTINVIILYNAFSITVLLYNVLYAGVNSCTNYVKQREHIEGLYCSTSNIVLYQQIHVESFNYKSTVY